MNAALTPDLWLRRCGIAAIAAIAAVLLALEATDAAASVKARVSHTAQVWLAGVERRQRGVLRRRALARAIRVIPRG